MLIFFLDIEVQYEGECHKEKIKDKVQIDSKLQKP